MSARAVPTTVLHAIDTWGPGGAETVCVEIASRLDAQRFHSVAAVIREGWVHDAMLRRGIDTTITRIGRGPVDVAYLWRLAALARRRRAALVQSHLLTASLYGGLAARLLGIPAVATFHGMVDLTHEDRWARVKLQLIAANASRIVFVSDALRQHFLRVHPVAIDRTVVVPNGIDPEEHHPAPHQRLREELGFSDDLVVVGSVGNVRTAKGYDDLIRVAAAVRDTHPKLRFVIAGNSHHTLLDPLLALRRELRVDDRVIFLGFRSDVAAVLNGVDLFLSTSTSEGFSITTIQAMACGIPVVATRSGGPEEIVTDGVDGVLVPARDPAAIARALTDLVADEPRRRRLAAAGRRTVIARFTLDRMIAAYDELYERALAERARPS